MATRQKFAPRPDHVFIGHMTFRIEYLNQDEWDAANENPDMVGSARHLQGSIRIRLVSNMTDSNIREVLVHEILHCIWSTSMLNQTHVHFPDKDREEEIVAVQSPLLLFVLQNNPEVMAYLIATEEH